MTRRQTTALRLALPLFLLAVAAPATAEWPYLTEGAATLPSGQVALSVGAGRTERQTEYRQNGVLLTPPKGVLWSLPELQGRVGVGPRAEVSADYVYYYFDPEDSGDSTYESGDLRLWTKVVFLSGVAYTVSGRVGVKVPTASSTRGIGTDNADVFLGFLGDLRLGPAELSGNLGVGILGDPTKNQHQDDVLTWGALVRAPVGAGLQAGVEAAGYSGPFGLKRERRFTTFGAVFGWQGAGPLRADLAVRRGVEDDRFWQWLVGVTYTR